MLLCWNFDGELEVEVGRGQAWKKVGGERIAIFTRLCLDCFRWEEGFCSGLIDGRAWEQRAGTGQLELEQEGSFIGLQSV